MNDAVEASEPLRPPSRQRRRLALALAMVVGALAAFVHWPVLDAQALSFDDEEYLVTNPFVRYPTWEGAGRVVGEVLEPTSMGGYYQPLPMLSLMLDAARGGGPGDLRPFHQTSLTLHALNAALVMLLFYALLGRALPAALAALLFGLHPMTVEPVAWVADRKTLVATLFSLLCMLSYLSHARRGGGWRLGLSVVWYGLAMLSKPSVVLVPAVLVLFDFWPLRRRGRRVWLEKVPFLAAALVLAGIAYVSQNRTAVTATPGETGVGHTVLLSCHLLVFYLYKVFWPASVSAVYPLPDAIHPSEPAVLSGVLGCVALAVLLAAAWRWARGVAVGLLIYVLALLPTLGVVQFTWMGASDKYAYLPLVGLALAVGWILVAAERLLSTRAAWTRGVAWLLVAILAAGSAVSARAHVRRWRDTRSLFEYMLTVAPEHPQVLNHLGWYMQEQGRMEKSVELLQRALKSNASFPMARNNLGVALSALGRTQEAIEQFRMAIDLFRSGRAWDPAFPKTHNNLGVALSSQGRIDEAIRHFERAIELRSGYPEAEYNLGLAHESKGKPEEAADHFRRAIELRPTFTAAMVNLGIVLIAQDRQDEAFAQFRRALRLEPSNTKVRFNLSMALLKAGELDEATEQLERVLSLEPQHVAARFQLGAALLRRGEFDRGAVLVRQAVEVRPELLRALMSMASQALAGGDAALAAAYLERVVERSPDSASALNTLAWIRATDPDQDVRRPSEAVVYAEAASRLIGQENAGVLDTLAAAYAAEGRFERAVSTAQAAISKAEQSGDDALAERIRSRLRLYQRHQPFIAPSRPAGAAPAP